MQKQPKMNKTQLDISMAERRQIVHRDYIAHCLRWSHILRCARVGQTWLDIGCGDFPLAMMLYTNKYKPKYYHGVDVRNLEDKKPKVNFPLTFYKGDIVKICDLKINYDNIVCLEMLEHVEKSHGQKVLRKIALMTGENTKVFISTPVFDGKHKAGNHIHEWRYDELRKELEKHFKIHDHYGTFASQRDIKPELSLSELGVYNQMHKYYDSNLLSIMFAPMHPKQSRNVLWVCGRK